MCHKVVTCYLLCGHTHLSPTYPCPDYYANLTRHNGLYYRYQQRSFWSRLFRKDVKRDFVCAIEYKRENTYNWCPVCYLRRREQGLDTAARGEWAGNGWTRVEAVEVGVERTQVDGAGDRLGIGDAENDWWLGGGW